MIDLIVNEEEDKANELFHEIVIESSRGIYENLITSEDLVDEAAVEEVSDDEVNNFISDIEADEEGISEEDDDIEDAEAELEDEMDIAPDGEEAGDAEGEEELEDRVVDLEDELEALKAEFNELMNDEAPAEEPEMEAVESVEEATDEEVSEESEEVVEDEEVVVEYAEKAPAPQGGSDDNAKSAVAKSGKGGMKNAPSGEEKGAPAPKAQDMGGTTKPDMKKV
ncbi:hypothetical protein N9Z41_01915 [bacterium]|nr:hypothetical protein [bacterium]